MVVAELSRESGSKKLKHSDSSVDTRHDIIAVHIAAAEIFLCKPCFLLPIHLKPILYGLFTCYQTLYSFYKFSVALLNQFVLNMQISVEKNWWGALFSFATLSNGLVVNKNLITFNLFNLAAASNTACHTFYIVDVSQKISHKKLTIREREERGTSFTDLTCFVLMCVSMIWHVYAFSSLC